MTRTNAGCLSSFYHSMRTLLLPHTRGVYQTVLGTTVDKNKQWILGVILELSPSLIISHAFTCSHPSFIGSLWPDYPSPEEDSCLSKVGRKFFQFLLSRCWQPPASGMTGQGPCTSSNISFCAAPWFPGFMLQPESLPLSFYVIFSKSLFLFGKPRFWLHLLSSTKACVPPGLTRTLSKA